MAAIAFDTLKCARRLIEAGVPQKQADVQAELMAEAFVHNVDSLVTRDYLDARFGEFEAKIEARFIEFETRIEARFAEFEARFVETEAKFEARFAEQEAKFEARFAKIESQLAVHTWILAAIAASTVIPALHALFSS